jgi:SAM-dependent methyltransferase
MSSSEVSSLTHSLDLLKDTYNYNHWIYSLLHPYLGDKILEVGAGTGNILQFMLRRREIVCLESSSEFAESLKQTAAIHNNVRVVNGLIEDMLSLGIEPGHFDNVLCLNVLEHIEDDRNAVSNMLSALSAEGKLLLFVPACQWAYGRLDKEFGHYRRYSRSVLMSTITAAGGLVEKCHYVNFIGVFGWWYSGRIKQDPKIDPAKARTVDRLAPFLSALERIIKPLVGQSLFAVVRKG